VAKKFAKFKWLIVGFAAGGGIGIGTGVGHLLSLIH
jgi:hypothetical protein